MALRISTGLRNAILGINTTMVTNGSFSSDATGWTPSTATLSSEAGGQSGNCLKVLGNGGAGYGANASAITVKVGWLYMVEAYFKKGDGANGQIEVGTSAGDSTYYDSGNITDVAWTKYQTFFYASNASLYITLHTNADAVYHLYDEVKVVAMARSLQDIFKDCFINIYAGAQMASADDADASTNLVTIYSDGAALGLEFDDAVSGVLSKAAAENWTGTTLATGTAGHFRMYSTGDTPSSSSTTQPRIDGSVSTSGAELNFTSTSFTIGAVQTISMFSITMPSS